MPRGNPNIAIGSLPTHQISVGIVALFEKICDGEKILPVVSNIGENAQYRCLNSVYDVKSVSQPDTMPILENNFCLLIIEIRFAEQF
jgi:hypothetical protein